MSTAPSPSDLAELSAYANLLDARSSAITRLLVENLSLRRQLEQNEALIERCFRDERHDTIDTVTSPAEKAVLYILDLFQQDVDLRGALSSTPALHMLFDAEAVISGKSIDEVEKARSIIIGDDVPKTARLRRVLQEVQLELGEARFEPAAAAAEALRARITEHLATDGGAR